jgi:hypothetical protein
MDEFEKAARAFREAGATPTMETVNDLCRAFHAKVAALAAQLEKIAGVRASGEPWRYNQ